MAPEEEDIALILATSTVGVVLLLLQVPYSIPSVSDYYVKYSLNCNFPEEIFNSDSKNAIIISPKIRKQAVNQFKSVKVYF